MTRKTKKTNKENEVLPIKVDIGDFVLDVVESSEQVLEGEVCNFDSKTLSWVKNKTRFAFDSLLKKFPNAVNVIASFPQKAKEIFALDEEQLKKMQELGLELKNIKGDLNSFESVFREKGKFLEQARLKKMNLPSSNPAAFTQALTMASIAKQIENLSIAVENVAENVNAVLIGQWDDRLALTDGAKRIFLTALECENKEMRQSLLSSAVAQNSIAHSQIYRSLKTEIEMCKDFKKKKDAECQKILDQTFQHVQGYFDSCRTQCILLNETQEYKALSATTAMLKQEIEEVFSRDNLLMLNSQTSKKDNPNFWSQTVNQSIESVVLKLDTIQTQAKLQLECQRKMEIGND